MLEMYKVVLYFVENVIATMRKYNVQDDILMISPIVKLMRKPMQSSTIIENYKFNAGYFIHGESLFRGGIIWK